MTLNVDSMIHLDMQVVNCDAEFSFNDIPIRYLKFQKEQFFTTVAHKFLIEGDNALDVTIMPGATPTTSKVSHALTEDQVEQLNEAFVMMRLVQYPVGGTPGEYENARVLAEIVWQFDSNDPQTQFPIVKKEKVNLPKLFESWHWQVADVINIEAERASIMSAVRTIHQIFDSGEGHRMAQVCQPYLLDIGRALPAYGEQAFRQDVINSVNENKGRLDWVKPFVEDEVDIRLCGNGRLVEVIDANWEPTIRTLPVDSGEIYPFRVFIGKIRGQFWVIA